MKMNFLKKFDFSGLIPRMGQTASAPGSVKYVGINRLTPVKLHLIDYNENSFTESDPASISECVPVKEDGFIKWLNISGVHNERIIHDVGERFGIHPLVMEDIANTTQRPKVEDHDDYIFLVIKMAYIKPGNGELQIEQVSMLVGRNYVISLQEKEGDILDSLRERLRTNKGKLRKMGTDYLMYSILDTIVDNYFSVIEYIGEQMEEAEEQLLKSANQVTLNNIYHLKRELMFLHKSIWPMREVINSLQRDDFELIDKTTFLYLRDVYDHTIQVAETLEIFREMSSGMLDLYLSTVSNRLNEVMKVLTIFAAVFIPLTFLAGVYGMNFKFMPELEWRYGYALWWVVTLVISILMFIFFKKKKWM
ncbi:MAG TPA: magnesium/cobalt transporter CorA [Bacteroidales bacterium]|nr:magnesium/cobalt transporter CorA [Bacteroidales bacterium]